MAPKIMYLIDEYDTAAGGTEGQLLKILRSLDRSRYEPAITVLRRTAYVESHQLPCELTILDIGKVTSLESIIKFIKYGINLRRANCRLVHCFFPDSSMLAPFFLKLLGIRVVVSRRDMGFWYTFGKLIWLRMLVPFVDCFLANCRAVKEIVQQREWVPEHKMTVIYNGYSSDGMAGERHSSAARLPNGVPIVGLVANLRPIKQADVLVRAFAHISSRQPHARLVVVGNHHNRSPNGGSMLEELQALATRLGVRERIIFTGPVEDAKPYINQFTVAVLCSESEGFSNSLIEYMQAGRPVICTDAGGSSELIQDGTNGFLVPVGDVERLGDRLSQLLSDSALAQRMGEAARITVGAYSLNRMISEQMACYDDILSDSLSSQRLKRETSAAQ